MCLLGLTLAITALQAPGVASAADDLDSLYGDAEHEDTEPAGFPDPCEGFNRRVFDANQRLDPWVVKPIVHAYDAVAPEAVQRAVVRVLTNLDSPSVFVNDLLQLDPIGGTITATRFALNTTIGLLGLLVLGAGRRVIPWILAQVARTRTRELFTLTVLVLALAIAVGSSYAFGVSMALGAFLAGMVVGQSEVSHQAAADGHRGDEAGKRHARDARQKDEHLERHRRRQERRDDDGHRPVLFDERHRPGAPLDAEPLVQHGFPTLAADREQEERPDDRPCGGGTGVHGKERFDIALVPALPPDSGPVLGGRPRIGHWLTLVTIRAPSCTDALPSVADDFGPLRRRFERRDRDVDDRQPISHEQDDLVVLPDVRDGRPQDHAGSSRRRFRTDGATSRPVRRSGPDRGHAVRRA